MKFVRAGSRTVRCPEIGLRDKCQFAEPFQADLACQGLLRKIFLFFRNANHLYIRIIPSQKRGDRASSRPWDGMRWTRERQARFLSAQTNDVFADGEAVWS